MQRIFGFLASAVITLGCWAYNTADAAKPMTYQACLRLVDENPVDAYSRALAWRQEEGGPAALHCMALALVGQGDYAHGARIFEEAARLMESRAGAAEQVPPLLSQAGNAWLLAENGEQAFRLFDEALNRRSLPGFMKMDLLTDRARASASLGDYANAREDLTLILGMGGPRADILTYRASAYRQLKDMAAAQADIEHAIRLRPDYAEALFERGNLKYAMGDYTEAGEDWQAVVQLHPQSDVAMAARENLAALEAAFNEAAATPPDNPGQPPAEDSVPAAP